MSCNVIRRTDSNSDLCRYFCSLRKSKSSLSRSKNTESIKQKRSRPGKADKHEKGFEQATARAAQIVQRAELHPPINEASAVSNTSNQRKMIPTLQKGLQDMQNMLSDLGDYEQTKQASARSSMRERTSTKIVFGFLHRLLSRMSSWRTLRI